MKPVTNSSLEQNKALLQLRLKAFPGRSEWETSVRPQGWEGGSHAWKFLEEKGLIFAEEGE